MSILRWILLISGAILIACIYFFGRSKKSSAPALIREEPLLDDFSNAAFSGTGADVSKEKITAEPVQEHIEQAEDESEDFAALIKEKTVPGHKLEPSLESSSQAQTTANQAQAIPAEESLLLEGELVVLNVFAMDSKSFDGVMLYAALQAEGFKYADNDIFVYDSNNITLNLTNAFKPGVFPVDPEGFSTHGVSIILQLFETDVPLSACERMVAVAGSLASALNGALFDVRRNAFTEQTATKLYQQVEHYQLTKDL